MTSVLDSQMNAEDWEPLVFTEEEADAYLTVALFSAKTVGPEARKKLSPLLRFYAGKRHPFTSCIRDNTKRFGADRAQKTCAVLKDLIRGTTKWRGDERKKSLSEDPTPEEVAEFNALVDEIGLELPEEQEEALLSLDDELIAAMLADSDDPTSAIPDVANYRMGDMPQTSCAACRWFRQSFEETPATCALWRDDVTPEMSCDFFSGHATFSEAGGLSEFYFEGTQSEDGWKEILREGTFKMRPGPGQKPVPVPFHVRRDGPSDWKKSIVSLQELVNNFKAGAIQHVTIPTSHDNKVTENTGFIDDLAIVDREDPNTGKKIAILRAKPRFTEPDIEGKVKRGTIANTSAGIVFDYLNKETAQQFGAVIDHVALTNKPWIGGLVPFGSANMTEGEVVSLVLSEEEEPVEPPKPVKKLYVVKKTRNSRGGESRVSSTEVQFTEEQVQQMHEELLNLRARVQEDRVEKLVGRWQGKFPPATVEIARQMLMADDGERTFNFTEQNGRSRTEVELTLSDVVERIMDSVPDDAFVNLTEGSVSDRDNDNTPPPVGVLEENLTEAEKTFRAHAFLHGEAEAAEYLGLDEAGVTQIKASIADKMGLAEE